MYHFRKHHHTHHPNPNRDINMLEGPLFLKILLFTLPLIATNFLQNLYNAADVMIVGLSHEAQAVGAVGNTATFIGLVVNLFIGFSAGATVVVSRRIGAGDKDAISRVVHTAILMSVLFGLFGAVLGISISRPVLVAMGNQGHLLELSVTYTRLYFLGIPFISLTNYAMAIMRAKGDTKTPMIVLACTGLINVLLNTFFVLVCSLSVEGVALATVIANAASASVLLFILSRDKGVCHFSWRRLRIHRRAFLEVLHIGAPAGISSALFSFSGVLISSSVIHVNNVLVPAGSLYDPVIKGSAASANLENFAYAVTQAIYHSAMTFVSRHVGAGKIRRVRRVILSANLVSLVLEVVFASAVLLLRNPLLALYDIAPSATDALAQLAYDSACERMFIMLTTSSLLGFMEVSLGSLRGLGKSIASMITSLIGSVLVRAMWIWFVFPLLPQTLSSVIISYPLTWVPTGLVALILSFEVIRKALKAQAAKEKEKVACPCP